MIIIEHLNGVTYNLDRLGIRVKDFIPSAPILVREFEVADGVPGLIDLGTTLGSRKIYASFRIHLDSLSEYPQKRDLIFSMFSSVNPFYLLDRRSPGRRWLVKCNSEIDLPSSSKQLQFEVEFISYSPYSESVNLITRNYSDTSFNYRNEGTQPIDMRHQEETEITFKGASNNLSIKNLKTGDEWKYTESTTANDIILLKGVRSLKNGQSIFGKTNHRLISLSAGNNEFKITGNTGAFELTIRTRFYFL